MNWSCKICSFNASRRVELLKHYRLKHGHGGHGQSVPCLYSDCPCSFKTWNALKSHLSRAHSDSVNPETTLRFQCQVCNSCSFNTEKQYFEHIGFHLRRHEVVTCAFQGCDFKTNIYSTFSSHRSRKHNSYSVHDFKTTILDPVSSPAEDSEIVLEDDCTSECLVEESEDLSKVILDKLGRLFLKLESIFNVSNKCIDEIVEELQFLSGSASSPIIKEVIKSTLTKYDCGVENSVISDLVKDLCNLNPLSSALGADGPFSTSYKRKQFFKEQFSVVEPIEYILDEQKKRTYQYVPILQSLTHILKRNDIQENILKKTTHSERKSVSLFETLFDGSHFKENDFFCQEELRLGLILYIDDFEICNPLGTSRKKYKVTAVYWVLANVPSQSRSKLTSIYLAILCKAEDTKKYGFQNILEPLLTDIRNLEVHGLYISSLGKFIKGTVLSVVADNLGAHSLAGFIENFTGSHICRFCLGERSQFQVKEVRTGAFQLRTKEEHNLHVQTALGNPSQTHCYGVKRQCAITEKLGYFHVTSGYPPDVLHDLLEGVVPVELALCLDILIKNKYFSLVELNNSIKKFSYKWSDKTNCPHDVPLNFASRRTVGGNAHENWCLLHLLPLIIGEKVPEEEPSWQMLMTLKDIVELVMSPVHTEESISFLDVKISEHRHRFLEVFPQEKLLPKHHFLEHYPQLIKAFGPLVALWTMRFEAKHSFFKKIVRQTNCFRNILLSLANKHQLMIAYHLHDSNVITPALSVTALSRVSLDVLKEDIKESVLRKFPNKTTLFFANKVCFFGTDYSAGMMVAYGSTGGLPDFAEILHMLVVCDKLAFIVKVQNSWYSEHLRSYELESTRNILVLEQHELSDVYPLAAYFVSGKLMVTLKHHICLLH